VWAEMNLDAIAHNVAAIKRRRRAGGSHGGGQGQCLRARAEPVAG
jgi:hypothetical protein